MAMFKLMALAIGVALLAGCASNTPYVGKRVFYLNSYHEGYPSSDQAMAAIRQILAENRVELRTEFLDSKRMPDAASLRQRGEQLAADIRAYRPDLLIVSDDDAVKYVVVPHFKSGPFPVVFCGVNWSCEQYGLPSPAITGMLEVVPVEETIRVMQQAYPGIKRLAVLSENSTSEQSNTQLLDPKYRKLGLAPQYMLVSDFATWKQKFMEANETADLIYLPTNGAIRNWNADEARQWVRTHLRKPVITCDDFMMPYCVFGLTKVAREQGEFAARTSLSILRGETPAGIPVTSNHQTQAYFNPPLARKIQFTLPPDLARRCRNVE